MTKLKKEETLLKGELIKHLNSIEYYDVSNRIFSLVEIYLIEVEVDCSGWYKLFKDSSDGRYGDFILLWTL